jgi:hypothetical protein
MKASNSDTADSFVTVLALFRLFSTHLWWAQMSDAVKANHAGVRILLNNKNQRILKIAPWAAVAGKLRAREDATPQNQKARMFNLSASRQ